MRVLAVVWVTWLCVLGICTAFADDTAVYGVGGALRPMDEHPSVVMDEMVVDARVTPEVSDVECHFTFRNTGPPTVVQMGFPESGNSLGGEAGIASFETWVDGKRVRARIEGLLGHPEHWERWRVKNVQFAAGQTRKVRVRYTVRTTEVSNGARRFEYRVGTGGSWKGVIGRALVRVQLEFNLADWSLYPDTRFRQVESNLLEWSDHDIEPPVGDSLGVRLEPAEYLVSAAGQTYTLRRKDVRRGHLWMRAGHLAGLCRAELRSEGKDTVIVLGDRFVRLRAPRAWMEADGRRVALPGAPFAQGRDLIVPVAAVARALGAEVDYTAPGRAASVVFPINTALDESVGQPHAQQFFRMLADGNPGWAPPARERFEKCLLKFAYERGLLYPWITGGDFNGDGHKDAALLLCKEQEFALVVIHGGDAGPTDQHWLMRWPAGVFEREHLPFLLQTRSPGEVAFSRECDVSPESGRVEIKREAVELTIWEKAATVCYWDDEGKRYRKVEPAD